MRRVFTQEFILSGSLLVYFLIIPPVARNGQVQTSAPMNTWEKVEPQGFQTVRQCTDALAHHVLTASRMSAEAAERARMARCVEAQGLR